jgi:hypothetical protein
MLQDRTRPHLASLVKQAAPGPAPQRAGLLPSFIVSIKIMAIPSVK